jgi:translation initiation factor IF-2
MVELEELKKIYIMQRLTDQMLERVGPLVTLKRFKDDVREVREGYECGLTLEDFDRFEVGDIIEFYTMERAAPPLRTS